MSLDISPMPSDNIAEFRSVLLSSKKILVLSGAGLSAASGNSSSLQLTTVVLIFNKAFPLSEARMVCGADTM